MLKMNQLTSDPTLFGVIQYIYTILPVFTHTDVNAQDNRKK